MLRSALSAVLLCGLLHAADTPKAPAKKRDEGPENPELKFKLPVPPVLTPEQELATIKVQKGYRVELVASEPMIETPVAMSWDDQGRLYVCEMRGYMNDIDAKGEDQPIGRISRLEDTDGDGKMDKVTVFADKLLMPRTVMALGDGALVAVPPNLIYFRDTDGDGVADKQEIVSKNYGREGGQPEHMSNSATWCQDNWIWSAAHPERYRFSAGQFITESTRSGGQWGLTQDDWGRRYFNYNSDLLRCDLLPPSLYARNPNLKDQPALNFKVVSDQATYPSVPTPGVNRGYTEKQLRPDGRLATVTGTCGPCVYRGDLMPEFEGNVFIAEPCGYLVKRILLSENGGVVTGKHAYKNDEFITSTDERFRPTNLFNGPDGALYIVDIARGVVQHKSFLTHYLKANIAARKLEQPVNLGRIWRVVPEGKKPQTVKLPKASAEIVPFLAHANGHIRDTAQRLLVERADASIAPEIAKLTTNASPLARIHALRTLDGLKALAPEVLAASLKDSDAKVRVAAVQLSGVPQVPQLLTMVTDKSAEVRLHLAAQLSQQQTPEAQAAIGHLLKQGGSPLLMDAVASGVRGREVDVLELALQAKEGSAEDLTGTGFLQMLANCVLNERRAAKVAKLLTLLGQQSNGSKRQTSIIKGMAGVPLDTSKKFNPQPRKLLYLESAPQALAALKKLSNKDAKKFVDIIDASLAWPGKPGVPPPPKVIPLTAEQQTRFDQGKILYTGLCGACHQPTGTGLDGLAPPLVDSDWVLGKAELPTKIVLHGLSGAVVVGGRTYRLEMPPLGAALNDDQIANVLTYVRREWEHNASPVAPADIAKVRAANSTRTKAWTTEELKPGK